MSLAPRCRRPRRRRARPDTIAFTLIEVLVAVALIALLAAVLIPALGKARAQARRGACASNLHQIAAAWHQYLDTNGGKFFQLTNANYNYGGIQGRGDVMYGADPLQPIRKPLNEFLKLRAVTRDGGTVFLCPSDTGGDVEKPRVFDYYGTSYTTNVFLVGQERLNIFPADPCRFVLLQVNKRLKGISRSSIWGESRLLLMGDFGWAHTQNPTSDLVIDWHDRRHSHNLAFMDGHVEFLRIYKGIHVAPRYTTIPFRDFIGQMSACQPEAEWE